ncbi:MAG: hypothetical protein WDO73_15020 [Ignavibacteriota bacterium]
MIENPFSRAWDRGDTLVNRPQAFNMSMLLGPTFKFSNSFARRLANDNQLSILANLAVGDEQNEVANLNLNFDPVGSAVQRPAFVGRDTLRTGGIYQVDVRYTRALLHIRDRIVPQLLVEANNFFNTKNVTTINTKATVNALGLITAQPSLAPTSTVLEGRLVQLGIRVNW